MSIVLDGTTQYGLTASSPLSAAYPMSIFVWYYPTQTDARIIASSSMAGTPDDALEVYCQQSLNRGVLYSNNGSTEEYAVESTGVTLNAWNSVCGVVAGIASRICYSNGVASTENTTSQGSFSAPNQIGLGNGGNGYGAGKFAGRIAHLALWDTGLSAGQVSSLAAGANPLAVAAANLKYYNTFLDGSSVDVIAALSMSLTGSPTYNASMPTVDAPPSGVSVPVHLQHLRQQGIA